MTTLAEQVAEVKVGDYVRVEFIWEGHREAVEGSVWVALGENLVVGGKSFVAVELYRRNGELNPQIISITRVPRPIPSEPEVGSFALLVEGDIAWRLETDSAANWDSKSGNCGDWKNLYPLIVRLYTPSGELVTGFEYYKAEGKQNV